MRILGITLVMVSTMLQWPNMILHRNIFIFTYLKPLLIIVSIAVFAFLGQKKVSVFLGYLAIMLAISINYSWVNGLYYNAFFIRTIYFVAACALFYRYPILIGWYLKIGIFMSALLGLQAFVLTLLMIGEVKIDYQSVAFINAGGEREFNWLAGFRNDPLYFRVTSYFTESNKLAYFLTPSLFVSYYYAKNSPIFKVAFLAILFGVASTFSIFSFFAIIFGATFFSVSVQRRALKYLLFAPIGAVLIYGIYLQAPEYFAFVLDKTGSISYRIQGIMSKIELITSKPFGAGEVALADSVEDNPRANSTLTMLHWGVVGGVQSIVFLTLLVAFWCRNILKLSRVKEGFSAILACGALSSLLQQSFYGTYFEYYFLSVMALLTASARIYTRPPKFRVVV